MKANSLDCHAGEPVPREAPEVTGATARLSRLLRVLTEPASPDRLLDRAMAELPALFAVDVAVVLVPTGQDGLSARAAVGLPGAAAGLLSLADAGEAAAAIDRRAAVVVDAAGPDPAKERLRELGLDAAAWLPLNGSQAVRGVLAVGRRLAPFTEADVEHLTAVADRIGLALEQAQQEAELAQALQGAAAERARAEEQLRTKTAELDRFVYSISHDLKAPLISIEGLAQIIVADYGARLDDEGRDLLERVQVNVTRMERLIRDLLELSRVGREAHASEAVDLAEMVDEFVAETGAALRARAIQVACRETGSLWGARTHVKQVLWHLLRNAVAYMGDQPAPAIEVGARPSGALVECYVRDNGIGIDPRSHDKIFEVFHRLHEVEAEGNGIGLTIARKVVERVGGHLRVESAKGAGTTFRFTWPAGPGGRLP
jgi:signal transduction histidine kinase